MAYCNPSRAVRVLLLAGLVLLPSLPAHASPDRTTRLPDGSIFTAAVDELRALWTGFWGNSGASIDPDGRMRSAEGREGMSIDPNGGKNGGVSEPVAGTDEGITIDPHG